MMTALAEKYTAKARMPNAFISLKKIAEEKHLSFSYLSQLVLPMKKSGLVESKEGLNGGYRLSRDPSKITLMEILETTEGKIAPVKCCGETNEKKEPCQCESVCGVKYAWQDAIELLANYLSSIKLSDLLKKNTDINGANIGAPIIFT